MDREAAVEFYSRLMRNLQLSVHRFRLPDFPQADMGFYRLIGAASDRPLPREEDIAPGVIYMVEDAFRWRYTLLRLPQDESLLLAGPYLSEGVPDQTIMAIMEDMGIAPALFSGVRRYYHSLRIISVDSHLIPILNTLGDALWGEERFTVEMRTLRRDSAFSPEPVGLEDDPGEMENIALIEKRYEIETKLMYAIAHGQTHQASAILSMINPDQIDRRSANPLRNMKNYAIICNTLMRKAAQQGSVHPFYIDQLSSTLARRIEETMSMEELSRLMSTMAHKYCLLVKNHNMKGFSPPVKSVMLRTDAEIAGDLSLHAHAEKIGINASYLSSLFKRETGVTLTDYVGQRRVDYAIFLLNSTNMQVQTIAQHCGMPDVNYFTRTFKKHTGKTPTQYRQSIAGHERQRAGDSPEQNR